MEVKTRRAGVGPGRDEKKGGAAKGTLAEMKDTVGNPKGEGRVGVGFRRCRSGE